MLCVWESEWVSNEKKRERKERENLSFTWFVKKKQNMYLFVCYILFNLLHFLSLMFVDSFFLIFNSRNNPIQSMRKLAQVQDKTKVKCLKALQASDRA